LNKCIMCQHLANTVQRK